MKKILNKKSMIQLNTENEKVLKLNIYGYIGYWNTSAEYVLRKIEDSEAEEIQIGRAHV